jgi:hypothetical protein
MRRNFRNVIPPDRATTLVAAAASFQLLQVCVDSKTPATNGRALLDVN